MMKKLTLLFSLLLVFVSANKLAAQGACGNAAPFCTGTTYNFPAATNAGSAPAGPAYGCLGSQPNEVWYYLQIANSGNITITLTNSASVDVDFICWGPFTSPYGPCLAGLTAATIEDCSYSTAATEYIDITGAVTGEYYMVMMTNFSNQPTNFNFSQTGGTGSTNCNVLCNITSMTAVPGTCNSGTNTFNVNGTINTFSPPTSGTLTISSSCGGTPVVLNPPFAASYNYTLTGLNATGGPCTVTASFSADPLCTFTVNITAPPPCNACTATASNTGPFCPGSTIQLSATGGGTYSWSGPGGYTATGQNPTRPGATAAMSGVYTVTVTVGGVTCTATTTVTVTAPATPTATNTGPYCPGNTIQLNSTGGGTYSWSGPGGFTSALQNPTRPAATTAMSGVYTVTVTTGACTTTASTTVTVNPTPTPTAANTGPYCPGNTISLSSTPAGATYAWSGPNAFTSAVQNPTQAGATTAMSGVYTVTVTVNGCTATATTNVTVNPTPTPTAANTGPYCLGSATQLSSTPAGATYAWSGPNGFTSALQNPSPGAATAAMAGVYTVTVTVNGCTATATTTLTINPNLVPGLGSNTPICEGNALNLSCSNGVTWSWTGPNGFTSNAQNPSVPAATTAASGNYIATVTDASGCTGTGTVVCVVNPLPVVTVNSPTICIGAVANLNAGGASTYSWTGATSSPTGASVTASPLITTTYDVTGTDANGCVSTVTSTVTVNPLPTITVNSPSICPSVTATLTATGGATYTWTGGTVPATGATVNATPASTSTYVVTGTDANGCVNTATATVTVNSVLVINAGVDDTICNGANYSITATGPAGVNYTWNPGALNGATQNLVAGTTTTFTVDGVDANGCTGQDQVVITVPPTITLATGGFATTCNGVCDGQLVVLANPTTGPFATYTYSWSNGGTNASESGICAGNYNVTVTDAAGCVATGTATVTEPTAVTAAASGITNASCNGVCDGSVLITPNGGTPTYTYAWVPAAAGNNPTTLCSGNYVCTVSDANGCSATVNVAITQPTPITVNINPVAPICIGQVANLTGNPGGGNGGFVYTWTGGTTPANTANVTANPVATTVYTLSVTDANGCAPAVASVTVTVAPSLSVTASNGVTLCQGAAANMSAVAGGGNGVYTYTWATGTTPGTGSNVSATPAQTTTYYVTVTDGCGTPPAVDSVLVTVNLSPVLTLTVTTTSGCQPVCTDFVLTSSPGAVQTNWIFSDGQVASNDSTPTICFTDPGTYGAGVSVTDVNGCTNTISNNALVNVYQIPNADFTFTPDHASELNPLVYFTDASTGPVADWYWQFNNPEDSTSVLQNPSFSFPGPGVFDVMLTVTSPNGCMDSISYPVTIDPDFVIYVPNAFTPNNEGGNETFYPKGIGVDVENYQMWIYDRWGNMIFTTDDWSKGWDGKVQGHDDIVMQDVFVWKIKLKTWKGEKKSYVGHVTVVK